MNMYKTELDWDFPWTPRERRNFCEKVAVPEDESQCWLWIGSKSLTGYGIINLRQKIWKAHRLMYYLEYGRMPVLVLDHLCRNRMCINPSHLEEVPMGINTQRGNGAFSRNARRERCDCGKPWHCQSKACQRRKEELKK